MKLFKSHEPNIFHYVTTVCYRRIPVFRAEKACELFIEALAETRRRYPDLNPVRAGLCDHPAQWKWSSYRAYLRHKLGSVPIEMDWRGYWSEGEFELAVETAGNARL